MNHGENFPDFLSGRRADGHEGSDTLAEGDARATVAPFPSAASRPT
jgi:hypothetical protein